MAGLRDFIAGSDVCTPSDGAGPSNAASSLVNALLGGRTKQQQQLQELPTVGPAGPSLAPAPFQPPTAAQAADAALRGDLPSIPGFASLSTAADVDAFLSGRHPRMPGMPTHQDGSMLQEFENIYSSGLGAGGAVPRHMPAAHPSRAAGATSALEEYSAASRTAAAPFLQAFLRSGNPSTAALPNALPPLGPAAELSVPDKCRVRDRSTILARQVFADQGSAFADQQVGRLLQSLHIDPQTLPSTMASMNGGAFGFTPSEWDRIYANRGGGGGSGGVSVAGEHASTAAAVHAAQSAQAAAQAASRDAAWVNEFQNLNLSSNNKEADRIESKLLAVPEHWAEEYSTATAEAVPREVVVENGGASSWADEFRQAAEAGSSLRQRAEPATALEQTKRLADTLASDANPKFQNSKFLQFVSKMSRGELILEDNGVKEISPSAAQWANEYSQKQQQGPGPSLWGEEFASFQAQQHPAAAAAAAAATTNLNQWAQEFQQQTAAPQTEDWAEQFAEKFASGTDSWADEFAAAEGGALASQWEEEYLKELEKLHSAEYGPRSSGAYIMSENNPFLSDLDSFSKGKELFRKGILTEAVLAFEAECQRNPNNAEAWRLLGTVQAENDDDIQAIAALNRALAAAPDDLDTLLSLGVSHTNELEQSEALDFLRQWVMRHPTHGPIARQHAGPPDSSQAMSYIIRLYESAAQANPQDADVHAALGVLCNLARRYDAAVSAFKSALALRPQDYSLWNKLGATLANSARSAEALSAYQKALDLKPNYMRAWTNMGISLANVGDYEGSARYYVRALALNRQAAAVWGYLKTSLSCAAREDLMAAADAQDLESLLKSLPL